MFRFPPLTPFVRGLLIALVTSFVVSAVLQNFVGVPIVGLLALDPTHLSIATGWQVFTHLLVMAPSQGSGPWVLISLLFVWWCLAPLELVHGYRRAVELTLLSALGAAAPALVVGFALPQYAGYIGGPSPIALAAIAAYVALMPPQAELSLGSLRLLPKHILGFNVALSVLSFLTSKNAAQFAADLGALGTGVWFARYWVFRFPGGRGRERKSSRQSGRLRLVKDDKDDEPKRWLN